MMIVFDLALSEFVLAFRWGRNPPGGRDFLALTALFGFTLLLVLVLAGAGRGIRDNLLDVTLGHLPGHGVPIWLINDPVSRIDGPDRDEPTNEKDRFITRAQVDAIESKFDGSGTFRMRVYRFDEAALDGTGSTLQFPGSKVWRSSLRPASAWAVSAEDPLWQWSRIHGRPACQTPASPAGVPAGHPFELYAVRGDFAQMFSMKRYLAALSAELPPTVVAAIRSRSLDALLARKELPAETVQAIRAGAADDTLQPEDLCELWLTANLDLAGREAVPFRIHWVDRLPSTERLSFLLPLRTVRAFEVARRRNLDPEVTITSESIGGFAVAKDGSVTFGPALKEEGLRWRSMIFDLTTNTGRTVPVTKENIRQWLGPKVGIALGTGNLEGTLVVSPPESGGDHWPGIPAWRLAALLENTGWAVDPSDPCRTSAVRFDDESVSILGIDQNGNSRELKRGLYEELSGYVRAVAYADPRERLNEAWIGLNTMPDKPVRTHPSYLQNFLRNGYVAAVVERLGVILATAVAVLLAIIVCVQVATIIGHRRRSYGVLIAKGLTVQSVWAMVGLQLLFVYAVGFILASGVAFAVQSVAASYLQADPAFAGYRSIVDIASAKLLNLGFGEWAAACAVAFAILTTFGGVSLWRGGVRPGVAPAALLEKGES